MVTANRRIGEKGQRTPRSIDAYQEKGGVKGTAYCSCGAVFRNKRWSAKGPASAHQEGQVLVCPACRRIADQSPAGIVSLDGSFYASHEGEIIDLVNHMAQAAVLKNPLGRIMNIRRENGCAIIATTDEKLAQKIGRELFKSHGGELHFIWSHAENPVRVTWSR